VDLPGHKIKSKKIAAGEGPQDVVQAGQGTALWRTPRCEAKMSTDKTGGEAGRTVTRADLSEVVYQRVGLSRTESAELVQSVLDEICDAAVRGETVKLSGFGSFVVRSKGERIGRNPKTGVEVPILPRRVMVFKPSNVLKAKINGRDTNAVKD